MNQAVETQTVPKQLVLKLAQAMAEIGRVEKRGRNNFHNYDYAKESDFLEEVRDKLAKRNIFVLTSVDDFEIKETGRKTREGNPVFLTYVRTKHTICDGDTGETLEVFGHGCGEDMGDKGIYKAVTGAMKYFIAKNFLIPTGDDPEKDEDKAGTFQDGMVGAANTHGASRFDVKAADKQDRPVADYRPLPEAKAFSNSFKPEPSTALDKLGENMAKDFVKEITAKSGPKKDGSTYTRYSIETLRSGFFTTFNGAFADIANDAKARGQEVMIQFRSNGRWKDVENIRLAEGAKSPVFEDAETLPF